MSKPMIVTDRTVRMVVLMVTIKEAATEFLATKRVAVTGVSWTRKDTAATLCSSARGNGVIRSSPSTRMPSVGEDRAYPDLKSIPGGVQAVVIGTKPETAVATMRECAELGISHVWIHRSVGAGSVSSSATQYGPAAGNHGDRRWLSIDVRPHRRRRAQVRAVLPQPVWSRPQARGLKVAGGERTPYGLATPSPSCVRYGRSTTRKSRLPSSASGWRPSSSPKANQVSAMTHRA